MSGVKRRGRASLPAVFSLWIPLCLLLILVQLLTSHVFFAGVFILSNEASISPFHFSPTSQHGDLSPVNDAEYEIKINIFRTLVILCLYIPVVLVAFALLAMLSAVYGRDRATLWVSMACQFVSSLLLLTGISMFLLLNLSYMSWDHMTLAFYICLSVTLELLITTKQTCVSGRWLTSDWK